MILPARLRRLGFVVVVRGPIDILVVEDDEQAQASIVSVLEASIRGVRVAATRSGSEALDYLFGRNGWADRVGEDPPKLILLDLALSGEDGFSVLAKIRELEPRDALTLTPIVVFSDSQAPADIKESYRCGANSYVIKPLSYPDFQAVVQAIGNYWISHNRGTDAQN